MSQILLVDDDEAFTMVLSRALLRRGHHTLIATHVAQAITLCEEHYFDKAIIDLKMSGPSGLTLIPELKNRQENIGIVMLTGYSSVATAVEAVKLGAINYLCKPARTDEILAAFEHNEGDSSVSIPSQPPSVDRLEWEHIQKTLGDNGGNISATARALGMHRRTLQRKLLKRPVKS